MGLQRSSAHRRQPGLSPPMQYQMHLVRVHPDNMPKQVEQPLVYPRREKQSETQSGSPKQGSEHDFMFALNCCWPPRMSNTPSAVAQATPASGTSSMGGGNLCDGAGVAGGLDGIVLVRSLG
eukprot:CAMPEP_0170365986 /NCGR_PEP_ID=MMETSP0117_2-20130122/6186_1 /TAXON_ID=400756 /ORGANISM="Durinskia baltica, Strain CSIRO CS-38" /LENGTH=121 /DNA_ID=CAMNT_0010620563 /DNA_START=456 /DNA_END=817 /DNA_ORIENTATION=-